MVYIVLVDVKAKTWIATKWWMTHDSGDVKWMMMQSDHCTTNVTCVYII